MTDRLRGEVMESAEKTTKNVMERCNAARSGNHPGTCGTVFKMTLTGALTTLHIFSYTDGANPGGGTDPGQRWELLRDHIRRRDYWRWNDLRNHINRHVDDGAQSRAEEWQWSFPHETGPALERDFVLADRSWSKIVCHFCPVWCSSVCLFPERRLALASCRHLKE